MDNKELNINEMEQVSGGVAGSPTPLDAKSGCEVYRVIGGDNLTRIAARFNTTVDYLMTLNKGIITNKNFIRAGFYIYVPKAR